MTKVGSKLAFLFVLALTGLAGLFGALLVGWFVVVARGLYLARHRFTLFLQFCFLYSSVFSGDVVFSLDLPFIFSGMLCTNTWGWNPQDGSSTTWSLTTTINHITPWSTMMIVMMMAWLMMMYIYYDEVCVCVCVTKNKHFRAERQRREVQRLPGLAEAGLGLVMMMMMAWVMTMKTMMSTTRSMRAPF